MSVQRLYNRMRHSRPFRELASRLASDTREISIRGASGSLSAFASTCVAEAVSGPVLVVCDDDRADALRDDLERILGSEHVGCFPAWGVSPYDARSPHLDVMGLRIEALDLARQPGPGGVIVSPVGALTGHTMPPEVFDQAVQAVDVGQERSLERLTAHLVEIGYERRPMVDGVGHFSVRGGILDVCSFGHAHPLRVEFFGDEITSIRRFNLTSQRSVEEIRSGRILPCREAVLSDALSASFEENLRLAEARLGVELPILRETLEHEGSFDGLEHYIGVLYGEETSLLDHLSEECVVVVDDPEALSEAAEMLWQQTARAAERQRPRRGLPEPLPAEGAMRRPEAVLKRLDRMRRILVRPVGGRSGDVIDFEGTGGRRYGGHLQAFLEDIDQLWKKDYEIALLCESRGQQARFEALLEDRAGFVSIYVGTLHAGFTHAPSRVFVVNDHEVYSRNLRRHRYRRFQDGSPIRTLSALQKHDFVVHVDYGIGRYEGIEHLTVDGVSRDCLKVCYRGGDRVFVPVEQMDRVQKYTSQEGVVPVLNKLGTAAWERLKARTRKEIFKMAAELVSLYAERKARPGTAFAPDTSLQKGLEASFPYQETRDQLQAIDDTKGDMERATAMDRLVCGDVGYGKTEVAIRAAFKAVSDGKQVAVLAPTTILAQQHFRTFRERMHDLPVTIDVLSRFRTKAEQQKVTDGLKSGRVDVVIGTHRLLSKDVTFKDLGLLVIDEEHRFGVRQKERLKQLKRLVDVLTLTATPIPRTLHMSLMKARDMSIIQTPPKDRLPILTEVLPFNESRVAEAILREVDRGGQVYFVHNRVQSMPAVMKFLEELLPQIRFGTGHGQMPERQLERVMVDFLEGKYDCLVSTMIIESGLDIPSVNTLIVNRADRLGLAQLYQLRGRVGRSNRQAYSYLLIPSWKSLSRAAVRRLRAIEEFSDLGSGFHISMRDLEIRGTGNLLGVQQHGHIVAVGFNLYCRLLDEAVREIRGEAVDPAFEPDVQVSVSAFIPEEYIPDPDQKMGFYQRLGEVRHTVDVLAVEEELADRFGPLPAPTTALLDTIQVKILARRLRLSAVRIGQSLAVTFPPERMLSRGRVEKMVRRSPRPLEFFLGDEARIEVALEGTEPHEHLASAKQVLESLV